MAGSALLIAAVYWLIYFVDVHLLSWQCLTRPIVVAPITGLVLGDPMTGIKMGAALESIFMGISAIGGSIPADCTSSSIIAVAFTILTGGSTEAGLALALPIGTVMATFFSTTETLFTLLVPYWEKLAQKNIKKFTIQNILVTALFPLPSAIVMFLAIAFGVEGLDSLLASLPAWIMTGFAAASSMMVAVGFAILCTMIWSKELGCFFFVGYILSAYLHLDSLPIAILGAVIAIVMFFNEKRFLDLKKDNELKLATTNNVSDDEEDFFE